ncbi:MAG: hypothetical protein ACYDIC_18175 [Desulfobaccales bacterium]
MAVKVKMVGKLVALSLIILCVCLGCVGNNTKSKMVKADPIPESQETAAPATTTSRSGGHSFAYMVAMAGGIKGIERGYIKDLRREEYVIKYELKGVSDKSFRYREKTVKTNNAGLLQLVGQGASLALMPAAGAAATSGNIAKAAGGAAISVGTVGSSGQKLTDWQKKMVMVQLMAWMPESEAKTPEEALAKMRQVLEQATQGVEMGDTGLVDLPKPVLMDNPPAVIIDSLNYTGKVWTWAKGPGITFTASKTDPPHQKLFATNDDVGTWARISERLPRWCFVFLSGRLAGNGQYFVGYPIVFWQGKPHYFGS